MFRSLVVSLFLASTPVLASDPLYILRTGPNSQQGIVCFDADTGVERPFASFIYEAYFGGVFGGLHLSAVDDRVVAQGGAYYEFDRSSGQLLRRYPALGFGYDTWAFQGVTVDEGMAQRLGIAPGIYGMPVCPPGGDTSGYSCTPPAVPFPGYETISILTDTNVLLRRGLAPDDTTLQIAKIFPRDDASFFGGYLAVDVPRQQFWISGQRPASNGFLQRLWSARIANGTTADATTVRDLTTTNTDVALDFAYDAARDAFFLPFVSAGATESRLVRRSLDGADIVVQRTTDGTFHSVVASPVTESNTYTQLLPAAADGPGANGTYWRSDVWLFNPAASAVDVTMRRVMRSDAELHLTLPAHASYKLPNVLQKLGAGPSVDAVVIESSLVADAPLRVYSRTYTPGASGGSYGEAIPAVPSLVGYSNHLATTTNAASLADTLPALLLDKRNPQQYRHNLGVVNTSDSPITMRLRYAILSLNAVDDPARQKFLTVPPHTVRQYTIEALFPPTVTDTLPPVVFVAGDRPAALWLSMVDNLTGDATFIPFTYYGVEAAPGSRLAIPAVVHSPGANGTFWRTDAYGLFWTRATGGNPQEPEVRFSGADCRAEDHLVAAPAVEGSEWPQFWGTIFPDVVSQLCPSSSTSGALEVRTGSWMAMVSRTYTTRPDGGTYGDILPLYPPRGWPARHFAGIDVNPDFRINVGLYNGSDQPSRVDVRLYAADGSLAGQTTIALAGKQTVQMSIRQMFGDLEQGIYGLSFATVDGVGCWPYVSVVDNVTGDPTNWW